jgi:hypothetical protein
MLSAQKEQSEAKEDGARAYEKRDPETDVLFEQGWCNDGLRTDIHTPFCVRLDHSSTNCEFLPIIDVESILDGRLMINNDSLSRLGDPNSGLGRMALLR